MANAVSGELNGLHPQKISEILESLKDPKVLKAVSGPWRARVKWQGGFRAKAYMRTHTVEYDEPTDLDATDLAASAHEQVLAAVGSCMMVGFILNATKRGVRIDDLEIALEGNFENILKWAGHKKTGNPGYSAIKAKVYVKADTDKKTLREIWKLAVDGSPVTQTVARKTKIIPQFEAL